MSDNEIAAAREADAYPYCATHGHSFDQEQGCVECVAEAMRACDERILLWREVHK